MKRIIALTLLFNIMNFSLSQAQTFSGVYTAEWQWDMNLFLLYISEPTRQAVISFGVFCVKKKILISDIFCIFATKLQHSVR